MLARRVVQRQVPLCCRGYVVRPPSKTRDPLRDGKLEQITPELTFIHRPPPTAPSPYSLTSAPSSPLLRPLSTSSVANSTFAVDLPPALPRAPKPMTRLNAEQIAEIQRLRAEDPKANTRLKLAKQFGCNQVFISMVAPLPKQKFEEVQKTKAEKQVRWSESKQTIRALRRARKEYW